MILNIYNTRDELAGKYGTPIFTQFTAEQMVANYEKTVKEALLKVKRMMEIDPVHAGEYQMQCSQLRDCVIYKVGTFDEDTGEILLHKPNLVCRLGDLFPREANLGDISHVEHAN